MTITEKIIDNICEEVFREDALPSNAGNLFRDILRYEEIGWRELNIVRKWLNDYLSNLPDHDARQIVQDRLLN